MGFTLNSAQLLAGQGPAGDGDAAARAGDVMLARVRADARV
jgi:hypothetical protein